MCIRLFSMCARRLRAAERLFTVHVVYENSNVHSTATAAVAMNRFIDLHAHVRPPLSLLLRTDADARQHTCASSLGAPTPTPTLSRFAFIEPTASTSYCVSRGRRPNSTAHRCEANVRRRSAHALASECVARAVGGRRYICSERSRKTFSSSAISGPQTSQLRFSTDARLATRSFCRIPIHSHTTLATDFTTNTQRHTRITRTIAHQRTSGG